LSGGCKGDSGNATEILTTPDPYFPINMSVWRFSPPYEPVVPPSDMKPEPYCVGWA